MGRGVIVRARPGRSKRAAEGEPSQEKTRIRLKKKKQSTSTASLGLQLARDLRAPTPDLPNKTSGLAKELLAGTGFGQEESVARESEQTEDKSEALEAGNPLSIEDMLQEEEEEDNEIIEEAVVAFRAEERPPLPLQPPPSTPPPPPSPQTRAEDPRMVEMSKVRPDLPPLSSEVIVVVDVPRPTSFSSSQAETLMECVQHLLGALTAIAAPPTPLAQQAALETSTGVADLLEAGRQLRAFLGLGCTKALSPQGETKLNTVSALAEKS